VTPRSRRLSGEQRRPQIVAAARRLFARRGYDATTTRQIAAEAGVSDALIYRHFTGKESLLRAIVDDGITRFSELGPPPQDLPATVAETVVQLGREFVAACEDQIDLLTLLISQQHVLGEDTRFVRFVDAAAAGLGTQLVPDDTERGYLLARSYMGSLVAYVLLQRRLGLDRVRHLDVEAYVRAAADGLLVTLGGVPQVTPVSVTPGRTTRSSPATPTSEEDGP
jgi:AcrR family transcriptional regulator